MNSVTDLQTVPIEHVGGRQLLLRDIAQVNSGTMAGQFDRYNMKRELSLTANIAGEDLGRVSQKVAKVLADLESSGEKPETVTVEVRGQIPPMRQMLSGLGVGLVLAIVVIFLLLSANFQSIRLALVTVSTAPAVIAGVLIALEISGSTMNIQSFIGAIMAIGVAMANAILLVTFAEENRRQGQTSIQAAVHGACSRLRPIAMTSCTMIAGMVPMAFGLGETGQQTAPLGRAVIGGLLAATFATLFILPAVFAFVQSRATTASASLDPDDPESTFHEPEQQATVK
jgi:multidrug efflux pump subunit AcrB